MQNVVVKKDTPEYLFDLQLYVAVVNVVAGSLNTVKTSAGSASSFTQEGDRSDLSVTVGCH
jgi:hypothetical protein